MRLYHFSLIQVRSAAARPAPEDPASPTVFDPPSAPTPDAAELRAPARPRPEQTRALPNQTRTRFRSNPYGPSNQVRSAPDLPPRRRATPRRSAIFSLPPPGSASTQPASPTFSITEQHPSQPVATRDGKWRHTTILLQYYHHMLLYLSDCFPRAVAGSRPGWKWRQTTILLQYYFNPKPDLNTAVLARVTNRHPVHAVAMPPDLPITYGRVPIKHGALQSHTGAHQSNTGTFQSNRLRAPAVPCGGVPRWAEASLDHLRRVSRVVVRKTTCPTSRVPRVHAGRR